MKIQVELAHSPRYASEDGTMIDLDVKFSHLEMTVPFTANGNDVEPHCSDLFNRAVAGEFGPVAPYVAPVPTQAEVIASYTKAMESLFDTVAKAKNYDNRITCALRAGYVGPFQSEGVAFAQWMDACNAYGYSEMDKVIHGLRPLPTIPEFIAELPAAPW